MIRIRLKKNKESILSMRHPWIFSGALDLHHQVEDGAWVEVVNRNDIVLATGHYQNHSIAVRILDFGPVSDRQILYDQRLTEAYALRKRLNLIRTDSNIYRLIHGEGDQLPGLIVDVYGNTAVVQCHSIGMHQDLNLICHALSQIEGINQVFDKSQDTLPTQYRQTIENGYVVGDGSIKDQLFENGIAFNVDWEQGQKTGFFIDQRDNRKLLGDFASGCTVLNAFSYSGGFSMYALAKGASEVISVDQSEKAILWAEDNAQLNGFQRHQGVSANVFEFLQEEDRSWDIVVIDPPAFAKSLQKKHNAVQAYKRLNAAAMHKVRPNGLLFTFSCSQVIDRELFHHTVISAAMEVGRPMQILFNLSQGADHPINIYHPEGHYLKGLVVRVG